MPQVSPRADEVSELWHHYVTDAASYLDARARRDENFRQSRWAYRDLNLAIGPLRRRQLTLVSSEVGTGKTTFVTDLCRAETFDRGNSCLLIAPSISKTDLAIRILAAEAGVTRIGELTPDRRAALTRAGEQATHANFRVVCGTPMTMEEAVDVAHTTWRRHDLDLIVIDDADLLTPAHRPSPRRAAGLLRQLADDLHLPVVVTARVAQDAHPDYSIPPREHQLFSADSGTYIDTSIVLHRPDADWEGTDRVGEIDLHVTEQNGSKDVVTLNFQGHRSRMTDQPWTAPPD